jgi:hypothetical protein
MERPDEPSNHSLPESDPRLELVEYLLDWHRLFPAVLLLLEFLRIRASRASSS